MPLDRKKVIEEAAKKGIDMSWLEQAPRGEVSDAEINRPSLSPAAGQLMEAVRQQQARTPIYQPFEPGTPTQQRLQAEEQARQFEAQQEESARQFDERMALDYLRHEADQAYREAQLAIQRAAEKAAAAGGTEGLAGVTPGMDKGEIASYLRDVSRRADEPMVWDPDRPPESVSRAAEFDIPPEERYPDATPAQARKAAGYDEVAYLVERAIEDGDGWDVIKRTLQSQQNRFIAAGINMNDAYEWALRALERLADQAAVGGLPHSTGTTMDLGKIVDRAFVSGELRKAKRDMGKEDEADPLDRYMEGRQ